MTGALAIIVAVVAATIFGVLVVRSITGDPGDRRVMHHDPEHWLAEARTAVASGRRIADELAQIPPTGAATSSADTTDELDRLTSRLAELGTNAPTSMDRRVCRNVAVRSRALSTALRALQENNGSPSPGRRRTTPLPSHQGIEFETAIRDLADHVELL